MNNWREGWCLKHAGFTNCDLSFFTVTDTSLERERERSSDPDRAFSAEKWFCHNRVRCFKSSMTGCFSLLVNRSPQSDAMHNKPPRELQILTRGLRNGWVTVIRVEHALLNLIEYNKQTIYWLAELGFCFPPGAVMKFNQLHGGSVCLFPLIARRQFALHLFRQLPHLQPGLSNNAQPL